MFLRSYLGLMIVGGLILSGSPGLADQVPHLSQRLESEAPESEAPESEAPESEAPVPRLDLDLSPDLPQFDPDLPQFYSVPRLIYTGTNRDWAQASSPTYYFTLLFPASEGAALGTVDLIQIEGFPITLVPEETIAFEGSRRERGDSLPVTVTLLTGETETGETQRGEKQRGLRIQFREPVLPGQTLTLAVRARSNPHQDGIYQYALVAYPQDNLREGYTLGIGRLHFYEPRRFRL